jgi:SAM-dependent methyltransferase
MSVDDRRARPASLSGAAAADPGYPAEALQWLLGSGRSRLLELSAGTGNFTAALGALGHDVIAADVSSVAMARLARTAPLAHRVIARVEDLPVAASSLDLVVARPAFGPLGASRVLPEIARVLRPGGVFAAIRRVGDHKVPWVRKVSALVGSQILPSAGDPFEASDIMTLAEHRSFRQWQRFDRPTLVGFVGSGALAVGATEAEREDLLAEAGALYDSYGRGPDGLLMPWIIECYRARVQGPAAVVTTDLSDDGLLIDFS